MKSNLRNDGKPEKYEKPVVKRNINVYNKTEKNISTRADTESDILLKSQETAVRR